MTRTLRLVGYAVGGLIALWILLELVAIVFGIVSWIVSTVITIAVLAVLLYVGYVVISSMRT
jgi:hypothetical protein